MHIWIPCTRRNCARQTRAYLSYELMPLYAIVFLVS